MGSVPLLMQPGGFAPNPKKSPKISDAFSFFYYLLLSNLLLEAP